jgi:hypothetical protein
MNKSILLSSCIVLLVVTARTNAQVVSDWRSKTIAAAANQTKRYRTPPDFGTDIQRGFSGVGSLQIIDPPLVSHESDTTFQSGNSFRRRDPLEIPGEKEKSIRSVFLYSSIGLVEVFSLGLGKQLNEDFSLSVKFAAAWIGSSASILPNGARGVGFRLAYHKPILFFNATSCDYLLYLLSTLDWDTRKREPGYDPFVKGHYFELSLGKETVDKPGFHLFWAVGFCISAAKEAHILYAPSLKIGVDFNFVNQETSK